MNRSGLALLACAVAFPAGSASLSGQSASEFAELIGHSERRIDAVLEAYRSFITETSQERLELVSEVNRLENELVGLRSAEQAARFAKQQQQLELEDLRDRVAATEVVARYTASVFSEYLTGFESRIHIAEDQRFAERLRDLRDQLEDAGGAPEQRIPLLFEAIEAGLSRQEALVGGDSFAGRAITREGGVKTGRVLLVGPTAYFASDDGAASGVLEFNSGTIEPSLAPLPEAHTASLGNLLARGSGLLPLDPSLGSALALKKARGTLAEHLQKGGWVGYAILALGAVALLIGLLKALDLNSARVEETADLRAIAQAALGEDREAARQKAAALRGPLGAMLATGVDFVKADTETLLDAMDSVILRHRPKLERFLPFLATTAAVAPLLGLLGTVVGMIKTFTLIEVFGTGDAKSLSSGISEALITTELGLIVAIPALILHGIFSRIMRSRLGAMEQAAADFSRHLAAERSRASLPVPSAQS